MNASFARLAALLLICPATINTALFRTHSMTLTPKPGILEITPYIGGRASLAGVEKVIKLSSKWLPAESRTISLHCGSQRAEEREGDTFHLAAHQRARPARHAAEP